MKNILFLTALLGFTTTQAQKFDNSIKIIQNNLIEVVASENATIKLNKSPFQLQFDNKFYNSKKEHHNATQIAFLNPNEESVMIEEGMPLSLIPYFESGSGFSADEDGGYSTVIINNYGHHYLYYENEQDHRIDLVSKNKGIGTFQWNIDRFYYNDRDMPITKFPLQKLKMVVVTDFNQNNKIDENELRIITIEFQK